MKPFRNKKAGILVFPGTNCEKDLQMALENFGFQVELLWHQSSFTVGHDIYFVPGGFSYGDYLRSGSLAARSLSMQSLKEAVDKNIMTVGICNGFQILTESHLLPGALVKNSTLKHICKWVKLTPSGNWNDKLPKDYALPVSHSEGNYIASQDVLDELENEGRILLRYSDEINGSLKRIAGISNSNGKVIGLMPHPERAVHASTDFSYSQKLPGNAFFDLVFESM